METSTACPKCGSEDGLPIIYGMPSEEMVEESIAGLVALGGCAFWPGSPNRTCSNCGHDWRADEDRPA
ncbi:MAG: hypothetical protein M3522_01540 [Actinomycetota bacterium]|jgi:hypothetical protein|nr:hypothetical protein [Actinomycetota bacterium]